MGRQQISNPTLNSGPAVQLASEVPVSEAPPAPRAQLSSLALEEPLASEASPALEAPLASEVPVSEAPSAASALLASGPPLVPEAFPALEGPLDSEAPLVFGVPVGPEGPLASRGPCTSGASLALGVPPHLPSGAPLASEAPAALETLRVSEQPPASLRLLSAVVLGGWNGDFSLLELINCKVLDPTPRSGRPKALSDADKNALVLFVKQGFDTRRMTWRDITREAGFSHVCDTTIFKALAARGIHAYKELCKFILTAENKIKRLVSRMSSPTHNLQFNHC